MECLAPGCHLVDERAQSENITALIGLAPLKLLRCHVLKGAYNVVLSREAAHQRRIV
jgi:hypothetical protein